MKIHRTFGRALPAVVAVAMAGVACGALAQSPPGGQGQPQTAPQAAPQGDTRDLLGRARSSSEGQMVEDLIKRLQGPAQGGAPGQTASPQTTVGPTPSSPAAPAAPGTPTPSRVATPPPAAPPVPPAATARTPDAPPAGPQAAPSGGVSVGVSPTPSTPAPAVQPAVAPQPSAPPTQQAQPRRLPRPGAPPTAAAPDAPSTPAPTAAAPDAGPGTGAPLQAPLPDSVAAPTATEPPPAAGPGDRRPPSRRAATQPVGAPPPGAGPGAPGQLPMTEAQIERMDVLPSIDVEVLFFIDSAQLTNRAFATLAILGRALADERLGGQVFLIAGHTDATGAPDYNLALSERRAQAVRDFLISNFGIAEDRLLARGFGPSRLKVPQHPGSRLNRRVQVVNWTSEADANAAAPAQPEPPQQPPRRRR